MENLLTEHALQFLPPSVQQQLMILFCGTDTRIKIASIGQAIMQTAHPSILIASLQFGLGVQMHNLFQSKFVVDSLYHHGFCCSYSEVKTFERSSSVALGTDLPSLNIGKFIQNSADNFDHNVRSIDW